MDGVLACGGDTGTELAREILGFEDRVSRRAGFECLAGTAPSAIAMAQVQKTKAVIPFPGTSPSRGV
jgi:hypothetical protein